MAGSITFRHEYLQHNPIVAKVGGLQSQGIQGRSRSLLLRALGNVGSGVLRLSRRVNNMATSDPFLKMHQGLELKMRSV